MRIGFLAFNYLSDWSGVERLVRQLSEALAGRGHEIIIIAEKPKARPGNTVPITPMPEGASLITLSIDTAEGREKARVELAAAGLDVAVGMFAGRGLLQLPWLFAGSGVPLVAAEAAHPEVITRELWNPYEHYGSLAATDRIQVLLPPYKYMYPSALQERITVIGNPFTPASTPLRREGAVPFRILGVGRFDERSKRFTMLLRAWALLAPDYPDWRLTLVGDGPDNALYRALSAALGVDDTVTFTGSVADPGPYYAESDILCVPSSQEGFGLVLAEGAAYDLPLVGCGGCVAASELIRPGMGALAEQDNPAALAEALRPLMSAGHGERQKMGMKARLFFEENYALSLITDRWEALLKDASARRGNTRLGNILRERWNIMLLQEAAAELALRENPTSPVPPSGAADGAAIARLTGEREQLLRDYRRLEKKYAALLREYQAAAVSRRKR